MRFQSLSLTFPERGRQQLLPPSAEKRRGARALSRPRGSEKDTLSLTEARHGSSNFGGVRIFRALELGVLGAGRCAWDTDSARRRIQVLTGKRGAEHRRARHCPQSSVLKRNATPGGERGRKQRPAWSLFPLPAHTNPSSRGHTTRNRLLCPPSHSHRLLLTSRRCAGPSGSETSGQAAEGAGLAPAGDRKGVQPLHRPEDTAPRHPVPRGRALHFQILTFWKEGPSCLAPLSRSRTPRLAWGDLSMAQKQRESKGPANRIEDCLRQILLILRNLTR